MTDNTGKTIVEIAYGFANVRGVVASETAKTFKTKPDSNVGSVMKHDKLFLTDMDQEEVAEAFRKAVKPFRDKISTLENEIVALRKEMYEVGRLAIKAEEVK